jgi:type IV pilus assembly protein PilY1
MPNLGGFRYSLRLVHTLSGLLLGLVLGANVMADDTEIFFPEEIVQDGVVTRPNLLFLMDTSGSMAGLDCPGDNDGDNEDPDCANPTRLQRMKDALLALLDSLPDTVRVGLARYSNTEGGAILFPVSDLDEQAADVDSTLSQGITVTGTPSTDDRACKTGTTFAKGTACVDMKVGSPTSLVRTFKVDEAGSNFGRNDAEQENSGAGNDVFRGQNVLDLDQHDNNIQYIGVRFPNYTVPAGAGAATEARLVFQCADDGGSDDDNYTQGPIKIYAERSANSVQFEETDLNISDRIPAAALQTPVDWTIDSFAEQCNGTDPDDVLSSPDVLTLLTNATSGNSGWSFGEPVTFILKNSETNDNTRKVYSHEGGGANSAARLVVTYGAANPADLASEFAVRFPAINLPSGVTATAATITFTSNPAASGALGAQALDATVSVEDSTNPAAYTDSSNYSSRSYATSVTWNSVPTQTGGSQTVTTVDISSLVNNRSSATGWCGGQAMAFKFTSSSNALRAFAGSNAQISITYSNADAALDTGCQLVNISKQLSANSDDAEELTSTGAITLDGSQALDVGSVSAVGNLIGLRFTGVALVKDSIIDNAYIEFTASNSDTDTPPSLTIQAQNVGDASTFTTTANDISNRTLTTASASWSPLSWTSGTKYQTASLTTLVQELVNRGDWTSGNDMVFVFDSSTAGTRRAYSRDQNSGNSAKLVIQARAPVGRMRVREYLKNLTDQFTATGYTPTVEALYETARYWRGESAFYGLTRGDGDRIADNNGSSSLRISHPATFNPSATVNIGSSTTPSTNCLRSSNSSCADEHIASASTPYTYKSPLTEQECSTNATILLTDGQPNRNDDLTDEANIQNGFLGGISCPRNWGTFGGAGETTGGDCGPQIADKLFISDNAPNLEGTQNVRTYTIGLSQDISGDQAAVDFLEEIADKGRGAFYTADSSAEILAAFQSVVQEVLDIGTTFVTPAVTVDSYNRLANRNEIYFALFRPQSQVRWPGNFKKYKLAFNNSGAFEIRDVNNVAAVDPATGFFKANVRSLWSTVTDGDQVEKGGILDQFPNPNSNTVPARTAYTYTGTRTAVDAGSATAPAAVTLSSGNSNLLRDDNAAVTKTLLGNALMTNTERTKVIGFAAGIDTYDEFGTAGTTNDARHSLGDLLHSEPVVVTYAPGNADGTGLDQTAFFGTNEGGLHAINTSTGAEIFSFVPQELLSNLTAYALNGVGYLSRPYGMDGHITAVIKDSSDNHYPEYASGRKILLIAGMRMGGQQYYALDVTERSAPKLNFIIRGGGTTANDKYRELGQTWSRIVPARIKFNGANRSVLVFTGGYDLKQDSEAVPTADTKGRALFIADADTGERLWWAGADPDGVADNPNLVVSEMTFSVPGSPKVIDLNGDGLADRIYIADVGGQIFRFDLDPTNTGGSSLVASPSGRYFRIATLGGNTVVDARRFYQSPDVALIPGEGGHEPFLAISIGSGYRGHPLRKTTLDRFYMIRDLDTVVGVNTVDDTPVTDADLFDTTDNVIADAASTSDDEDVEEALEALWDADGYYVNLGPANSLTGEKVLTDAQTFAGEVLFSTYTPGASFAGAACQAAAGLSKLYLFRLPDGQPVHNFDGQGAADDQTAADRYVQLHQGGLPPTPALLFPTISTTVLAERAIICVGPECLDPGLVLSTEKTYWIKKQ